MSARILQRLPLATAPRTQPSSRVLRPLLSSAPRCPAPPRRAPAFHTLHPRQGIMPHSENPAPRNAEPSSNATSEATAPTPLSDDEYHDLAEGFLTEVAERIDEVAEGREDVIAEFESGVLTITFPPAGTYVLNKQPPNKQIWLSSPVSGPKRYDWVVAGEGMNGKEGGGVGEWVYLRDGSGLTDLLSKELGISVIGAQA